MPAPKNRAFKGPCRNHHLAINNKDAALARVIEEEKAIFVQSLDRCFRRNPLATPQQLGQNDRHIPMDVLVNHIVSKKGEADRKKLMLVCKAWGRAIAEKWFEPNYADKFHQRTAMVSRPGYQTRRIRFINSEEERVTFMCTCQTWKYHIDAGRYPWWMLGSTALELGFEEEEDHEGEGFIISFEGLELSSNLRGNDMPIYDPQG